MFKPDKRVKNYEFSYLNKLGQGAYACVYAANEINTRQLVAIKVVKNQVLMNDYTNKLMKQEIEIMKALSHPNIVKMLDVFHSSNNTYIVTELCNGGDMKEYLKNHVLEENRALATFRQIMSGVQELLNNGIVHRDIKPANILLHDNLFKITDFGFARKIQEDEQPMDSIVGTPLYMSPQILSNKPYTSKTDIWSLGLILYEMICGQTPWPATNFVELINKLKSIPLRFPSNIPISDRTKNLIAQCLQSEEKDRINWDQLFQQVFQPQQINTFKIITQPGLERCKTQSQIPSPYSSNSSQLTRDTSNRSFLGNEKPYSTELIYKKRPLYKLFSIIETQIGHISDMTLKQQNQMLIQTHKSKLVCSQTETIFDKNDEIEIIKVARVLLKQQPTPIVSVMIVLLNLYRKIVLKNVKTQTLELSQEEIQQINNCETLQKNQQQN